MLDYSKSKDYFEPYRHKLKGLPLIINNLYFNEMYNLSHISENVFKDEEHPDISLIKTEFSSFYEASRPEENYRSKYEDFKIKKQSEIELHEICLKIGFNLSKLIYCSKWLLQETCYVNDLLDFLIYISRGEIVNGETKDIVEYLSIVKKKKSQDAIKAILLNIIELSLNVLINFINLGDDTIAELFINKVIYKIISNFLFLKNSSLIKI